MLGASERGDTLGAVTTKSSSVTSPARALRSSLRLSAPLAAVGAVLAAGPAMADLPEAWATPDDVQFMDLFMLVVGWPLVIAAVVAGLVHLANLRKPGHQVPAVEGEWLGGPRDAKGAADATSAEGAGGASGQW